MEKIEYGEIDEKENKTKDYILSVLLIILLSIALVYLTYKIFYLINLKNNKKDVETVLTIETIPINISCEKTEISTQERVKINIKNYNKNITLQSSNPEIIAIEGDYIVGISEGEATIYAFDGKSKSNEITIKCIVELQNIELNKTNIEIEIGGEENLFATITPENSTYKELIWESSDESIVKVENGKIKAMQEGNAIVTVCNIDKTKTANCQIIVKEIEVKSVSLDDSYVNLGIGQAYILRADVKPSNATDPSITWESSNKDVISVNDGKIKAISEGEANIIITSKNGKTAICKFYVSKTKPTNKIKYATESFNVRVGPGTNYKLITSVKKNDEIEILKEETDWIKLRLADGTVGYTVIKAYSNERTYYIEGVPYINQFDLGYPTGCEAVSATMAAKFAGYNVSVSTIVSNTPTDTLGKREETRVNQIEVEKEIINEKTGKTEILKEIENVEEKVWVGGNPFEVFIGHPSKGLSKGSYGCFANPIVTALNKSGVPCSNISGCSVDNLYEYVKRGKPVIVWCKKNAGDLTQGVTWQYPDGSGEFTELVGEHCAVLIGYDGDYVYLNDPSAGENVKQPKGKFESNWYKLYSQAIVIN